METGYCPKCNRDKEKGEWTETELNNTYVDIILTSKGHRKLLRGTCSICKKKVTKFVKNRPID